jgi:spore germination protein YaaH
MRLATIAGAILITALGPLESASADEQRMFALMSHEGGVELDRLREFGECIDVVAPNWYSLGSPRGGIPPREPDAPVVDAARESGTGVWPVVNATFPGRALAAEDVRRRLTRKLTGLARRHSYDGITLDIEGLDASVRDPYSDLVRRLDSRLARAGRGLAVYVPRRTSAPPGATAAPYDWAALSAGADLVLASGYNEHYSGGTAGPITTSAGFASVLDYAAGISTSRIAPTIGAFGYRWPFGGAPGELVSTREIEESPPSFIGTYADGEVAYLTVGAISWSETTEGMRMRRQAAAEAGFDWVGLFSLGRESPGFWPSSC